MSEDYFYDRDHNILGVAPPAVWSGTVQPMVGSSATFEADNFKYDVADGFYNMAPKNINSLRATFDLRFESNYTNIQGLVNYIEYKSGYIPFLFNPDAEIYNDMSGVCSDYTITTNRATDVSATAKFEVNRAVSPIINWQNGTFNKYSFTTHSTSSVSYDKYDVVYQDNNTNKLNNFYYCVQAHTSSASNAPNGASGGTYWTQSFFFAPDAGNTNNVSIKTTPIEWDKSFRDRIKNHKNAAAIEYDFTFKNIPTQQLLCLLHFLESKAGCRRFLVPNTVFLNWMTIVFNTDKVMYCPKWTHEWVAYNSHTVTCKLIEDPMGVLPTNT